MDSEYPSLKNQTFNLTVPLTFNAHFYSQAQIEGNKDLARAKELNKEVYNFLGKTHAHCTLLRGPPQIIGHTVVFFSCPPVFLDAEHPQPTYSLIPVGILKVLHTCSIVRICGS